MASSAALGVLLQEGIGDTIRISLTPEPGASRTQEVIVAQELLQTMGPVSYTHLDVYKRQDQRSSRHRIDIAGQGQAALIDDLLRGAVGQNQLTGGGPVGSHCQTLHLALRPL